MIDDIVLGKTESIERCVRQIRLYYGSADADLPFEKDFMRQDAIAINIQRAAELCIDLANHAVKVHRLGIPKESRESFDLLEAAGFIPEALSRSLGRMVGFRNVLVHEYRKLDVGMMKKVVENRLDDFLDFTRSILRIE